MNSAKKILSLPAADLQRLLHLSSLEVQRVHTAVAALHRSAPPVTGKPLTTAGDVSVHVQSEKVFTLRICSLHTRIRTLRNFFVLGMDMVHSYF